MGYYISNQQPLESYPDTVQIQEPETLGDVGSNQAIICEVDNGLFKAYAFAYSQEELNVFKQPDGRPKKWFTMPLDQAKALTGY